MPSCRPTVNWETEKDSCVELGEAKMIMFNEKTIFGNNKENQIRFPRELGRRHSTEDSIDKRCNRKVGESLMVSILWVSI